ncbi:hypothetical protein V8B97DRAFT_1979822 [Scleroderma yunnanense]
MHSFSLFMLTNHVAWCTFTLLALIFLWKASMYYCDSTFPSLVSPFLVDHRTVCFARPYSNECLASGFSKARPSSESTLGSLAVGHRGHKGVDIGALISIPNHSMQKR